MHESTGRGGVCSFVIRDLSLPWYHVEWGRGSVRMRKCMSLCASCTCFQWNDPSLKRLNRKHCVIVVRSVGNILVWRFWVFGVRVCSKRKVRKRCIMKRGLWSGVCGWLGDCFGGFLCSKARERLISVGFVSCVRLHTVGLIVSSRVWRIKS